MLKQLTFTLFFLGFHIAVCQELVTSFNMPTPLASADINIIEILGDDKILVGGDIDHYDGTEVGNLIRLNADGSLDNNFNFTSDIKILELEVLSTGEIIALDDDELHKISTSGAVVNSVSIGVTTTNSSVEVNNDKIYLIADNLGLKKYNADLTLDMTFNNSNTFSGGALNTLTVNNNKIIVSGLFNDINGTTKNDLAQFDLDGTLDLTFDVGTGTFQVIKKVIIQADGKVIIGNTTSTFFNGQSIRRLARLNTDGSIDTGFSPPEITNDGRDFMLQGNKILLSVAVASTVADTVSEHMIRLNIDGTIDQTFNRAITKIEEIAVNSSNEIFTDAFSSSYGLNKLNEDGTIDMSFNPPITHLGHFIDASYKDGSIFVMGDFSFLEGHETFQLAKLDFTGKIDQSFTITRETLSGSTAEFPFSIVTQGQNAIYVGLGQKLVKTDTTGTPDPNFVTSILSWPSSNASVIEFLGDTAIVTAGQHGVFLHNADGSRINSFSTTLNVGSTGAMDVQSTGKIIYGSAFTEFNGAATNRLVRLNLDGTTDNSFDYGVGPGGVVRHVLTLPNDETFVINAGGFNGFSNFLGVSKLKVDGVFDTTFFDNFKSNITNESFSNSIISYKNETFLLSYLNSPNTQGLREVSVDGNFSSDFNIPSSISIAALNSSFTNRLTHKVINEKFILMFGEFQIDGISQKRYGVLLKDNDIPVITGTSIPLKTNEDQTLLMKISDFLVTDKDNSSTSDFSLSVLDGSNYTHSNSTITPASNYTGTLTVPVKINDGLDNSATFEASIQVTPVNDKPVIVSNSATYTVLEDSALAIALSDFEVQDPDNTFPTDFYLALQTGENYTISNSTVKPNANYNGQLTVPVIISDGTDSSAVFNINITVTSVNDIPSITGTNETLTTNEDQPLEITLDNLSFSDADSSSTEEFSLSLSGGENYTQSNNTIFPSPDYSGIINVPVRISDGTDSSEIFQLEIIVNPINDQPIILSNSTTYIQDENGIISISLNDFEISDPDNSFPDDFSLSILTGENYTVDGTNILPDPGFQGQLTVSITFSDGINNSEIFELKLDVSSVLKSYNRLSKTQVFPNPTHDIISILFSKSINQTISVSLVTLSGKVIINKDETVKGKKVFVDLSDASSGVHLLVLKLDENNQIVKRIVIH